MKILVCIASYGENHWDYLDKVLANYDEMNYDVDVILDITSERDEGWPSIVKEARIHPPSIEEELVFCHRKTMAKNMDNYDLYIYSEDDILITQKNITKFMEVNQQLPPDGITGFIRFEQLKSSKYLIDCHPQVRKFHPIDRNPNRRIILEDAIKKDNREREYFRLWNLHQGSWILTNPQLQKAIHSGGFLRQPSPTKHRPKWYRGHQYYGILESGASDIYTRCGFKHKMLPIEGIEDLLIHHLPDKYIQNNDWGASWPLTLSELKYKLNH